jgi:ribosome-binding factor A
MKKPTRRQEKVCRVVKEAVSSAIQGLSDPRIEGIVSVTRVEMSPDLRNSDVYLSIMGSSNEVKTYEAIKHARSRIQSVLADTLQSKFCPVLHFHIDDKFKKTLETLSIIERATQEYRGKESVDDVKIEDGDSADE